MGQYQIPKELEFETLRYCLDNYESYWLYIREKGKFSDNKVLVSENIEGKTLDFVMTDDELHFLIDSKRVHTFDMTNYNTETNVRPLFIEYERFSIVDGMEKKILTDSFEDPYDPNLPEPKTSLLRRAIDDCLLEIAFKGRIDIEFHSWWDKDFGWKYWKVV